MNNSKFKRGLAAIGSTALALTSVPAFAKNTNSKVETYSYDDKGNKLTHKTEFSSDYQKDRVKLDSTSAAGFAMAVGALGLATGTLAHGFSHGFRRKHAAVLTCCAGLAILGGMVSSINPSSFK